MPVAHSVWPRSRAAAGGHPQTGGRVTATICRSKAQSEPDHTHLPFPRDFEDTECTAFRMAILGDLHLPANADRMSQFHEARTQLRTMIHDDATAVPRVIQLGDLGSYEKKWPGSQSCFSRATEFLDGFGAPTGLILGNHDLEGDEFETDEENLVAWHLAFRQRHYWTADVGPATVIGLSTTKFRSNQFSVHEVHINDEQIEFFEAHVQRATSLGRPVVVFTHAPIIGSGLKVVQAVHVKNRCAWVNHSSPDPSRFIRLVQSYSNIKLWFSGHFHLSQNYPDSISVVGGTAFVLTGVIGDDSTRDGLRQSRLLKGTPDGFELYTVDHDGGTARCDLRGNWHGRDPPEILVPTDELLCDPSSGWLCSEVDCSLESRNAAAPEVTWWNAGPRTMLSRTDDLLIEYDVETMAPIGAVFLKIPEGAQVRLVDGAGHAVDGISTDGSEAVAVELFDPEVSEVLERVERNDRGCFFQIFQPNKVVARRKKEEAEAAALAASRQVAS